MMRKSARILLGVAGVVLCCSLSASGQNAHYTGNRQPLAQTEYIHLPLGSVQPRGWLAKQLRIQADGLTAYINSEFPAPGWDHSYYEEGLVALSFLVDDPRLRSQAKAWVDQRLSRPPDSLWSHYIRHAMRYMIEYQEATGDQRIIPWMHEFYLRVKDQQPRGDRRQFKDRPPEDDGWDWSGGSDHLTPLIWLYNRTGDKALLDMADAQFRQEVDGMTEYFLNFPSQIRWKTPVGFQTTHGVDIAYKIKYPGLFYCLFPEPQYRQAVFEGITRLDTHYGQVGGRYTAHEHLAYPPERGREPTNGTELCAVVEYAYTTERLFEIWGDTSLADRLELLVYNCVPGTMTPDMWAHQYDQQANQVLVSDVKRDFDNDPTANIYGFAPHFPCCLDNMHQGWPRFVESMWMATQQNGLVAATYGPCEVRAKVGDQGRQVTITEETEYPFDGKVRLQLTLAEPTSFPLCLRIPGWAEGATVEIAGETSKPACQPGSVVELDRKWNDGDTVTLDLPLTIRAESRCNNSMAVLRGPLYYSLRIGMEYRECSPPREDADFLVPLKPRQDWAAKPAREKTGLPIFDWEIHPTTPWNYALVVDRAHPETAIQVIRNPVGDVPFGQKGEPLFRRVPPQDKEAFQQAPFHASVKDANGAKEQVAYQRVTYQQDEPVVLKAKARLLPEWKMLTRTKEGREVATSAASPPPSPVVSDEPEVNVELIPYGCARLRISEFPVVEAVRR